MLSFFAFGQVKHIMILTDAHVLMQKNLHITNEETAKTIKLHVSYQYCILLLTLELKQPQLITCSELS
jgi:hypothetical protein